jgi:hypothetical protein
VTQITEHFSWAETAVSAGHPELVKPVPENLKANVIKLATTVLEPIRQVWHEMQVLSWYRSEELNKAIGGSPTSQHRFAEAADITTRNVRGLFTVMYGCVKKYPTGQVIAYPKQNFIHMALPSAKYPDPTFFICTGPKRYEQVKSLEDIQRLWH